MWPEIASALFALIIIGATFAALERVGNSMLKGWSFGDEQ